MTARTMRWTFGPAVLFGAAVLAGAAQDAPSASGYKVTIRDDKPVVVENAVAVDPAQRIRYTAQGIGVLVNGERGEQLQLSHFPTLNIDGQVQQNGGFGGVIRVVGRKVAGNDKTNQPLGKTAGGRQRHGFQTVMVQNDLRITYTCEVVPTRPAGPGQKRVQDSVLCRYLVENKGQKAHKFGLRIYMDVFVVNNDGAMFAAPTIPGKIIDGITLKGKTLPDYVQLLQNPDLKNPGYVAHLTLNLGNMLEKPDRVVLTRHGVGLGTWEMQPVPSMGDSALGVFWEPKEIRPGGKREFAYGYGKGIVLPPEGEGQYEVKLGGSFEPGKLFTVSALVADPAPGQALTLQLPPGVELVEGRAVQPVPPPVGEIANSVVMWKGRVTRPGAFPVQVRSNSGTAQTKVVTVEKLH